MRSVTLSPPHLVTWSFDSPTGVTYGSLEAVFRHGRKIRPQVRPARADVTLATPARRTLRTAPKARSMVPVPVESSHAAFVDRRRPESEGVSPARERRQFGNSYEELSPPARELGETIDEYKLVHR